MNSKTTRENIIKTIARIRAFEQALLELFSQGKLFGTTHTCIGQEVCAAALYGHLDREHDVVFSNHRCHGHFLAFGGSMEALLAEIMGKEGALCGGRGGSQHLCDGRFFSQGVQGQSMPIATGYAYQMKRNVTQGIVIAHIGDGTLGQGIVYESLNIASILDVPLLVVVEHNGIAQSTNTDNTTAGNVQSRFEAFGIETDRRKADDPVSLAEYLGSVIARVRSGRPFVQILDTFRLMAHSKGDDNRQPELIAQAWRDDWFAKLLDKKDPIATEEMQNAVEEVSNIIESLNRASSVSLGCVDTFASPQAPLIESSHEIIYNNTANDLPPKRINQLLNDALEQLLAADKNTMLIGEDIADPYGGTFKVTRSLLSKYPEQVFSTPISEAAIVGFGSGLALAGCRGVIEIMFGDFITLATDQIVNQAAKIFFMYGQKVNVPITVRVASGGYRGYGPTHSQCLETMYCQTPGLKVIALSRRHDPGALITAAVADPNPVLFIENKLLYALRPNTGAPDGFRFVPSLSAGPGDYPPLVFTTCQAGQNADVTVVTYGGLTDMVENAMETLILEEELEFDYIILSQLCPMCVDEIAASVQKTTRLLVVEEGYAAHGIGPEVLARVLEDNIDMKNKNIRFGRVACQPMPIPNARDLELQVLPNAGKIAQAISEMFITF